MRKTVFNRYCYYFIMIKGSSSLSPLTFEINEGVKDEVVREGGSTRLQESLEEEVSVGSPHHQETDWENASLTVLDCRGGRVGRSDPSPPVSSPSLLHHSAFHLITCITPSNPTIPHFFIFLYLSRSIKIISHMLLCLFSLLSHMY